jgi:hypothetical protein
LRPERFAAAHLARIRAAIARRAEAGIVRVFLVAGALPPFWSRTLAQRLRAPARMFANPWALSLRLPEEV